MKGDWSTTDWDLMKLVAKEKELSQGSTDENVNYLNLLASMDRMKENLANEPHTEYISAPMVKNAHSAIDSLIMQNNQQQNILSSFPGKELGGWILDLMELTLGTGMPLPNPANKKP